MHYHIDIWDRYGELMMQSTNLEWELVQDRVLAAYQHGNPLTLDGSTVSTYSISRIRILETDHEVNPMASYHDESLPEMGYAYTTEERDVTNRWITGPPGHGTSYAVDAADQSNSEDDSQGNFVVQRGDYSRPDAGTREVFVVHGRNSLARDALFEFLRSIDLRPLEWSEAVRLTSKASPYIGEVLHAAFSRAHAVMVLMSPDDEARLREPFRAVGDPPYEGTFSGQARPNVLFEAGMAMAWSEDRTILVALGNLRPFSDIGGRHVLRFDDTAECRQQLAQRLDAAGCPVKTDGTDWLSAGDFASAIELAAAADVDPSVQTTQAPDTLARGTVPRISEDAAELLFAATDNDSHGIMRVSLAGGTLITAAHREFSKIGDRRSEARWESALEELVNQGLAQFVGGESFEITHLGFTIADGLRGTT